MRAKTTIEKLRGMIDKWLDGEKARGINVSLATIRETERIAEELTAGGKPEFIDGQAKAILDKCGIKTKIKGIGWQVA